MAALLKKPSCEVCEHFANKRGEGTPCDTCYPEVRTENADAVDVFIQCMNQVRFAPNGKPLGIDYNALEIIIKRMGVYHKNKVFNQVLILEQEFILKGSD